jgi:protoheme IX farnesyltransferase
MKSNTSAATAMDAPWRAYLQLCKLKVVGHIVFTAVVGMFLAMPGMVPLPVLLAGTSGIGLAAASAAALNHYLDRQADAEMARTKARPLPAGRLEPANVIAFALTLGALSMFILVVFVNTLTAVLTFLSLIGYAIVYTVYLKHATPQNIVIGGAAGAAPPVLGWCAATGQVHPHALLLFLIIFLWTPPHFWAYAIAKRDDYAKAKIPMLPVTHGVEFTQLHVLLYTILLIVVSLLPYLTGMSGLTYLLGAVLFGAGFLYHAILLKQQAHHRIAMKTFAYSLVYLIAIFSFLLLDHYFWIPGQLIGSSLSTR